MVNRLVRLTWDPDRRAYRDRRRADGKSDREIIRCLKRYVAREMFRLLTNPLTVHVGADLRTARNNANITLQTAAEQLNTWPVRLSRIERGLLHDNELTNRYHNDYTPKSRLTPIGASASGVPGRR